jgi:hypothetical protein
MTTINWIETGHRREAGHRAAPWRLIGSQLSTEQARLALGSLWYRIGLLSRIRDRLILRARLRAYVG